MQMIGLVECKWVGKSVQLPMSRAANGSGDHCSIYSSSKGPIQKINTFGVMTANGAQCAGCSHSLVHWFMAESG
jgi:hypothetical protein